MSLNRSLKSGGSLSRHRNVLTRAERIAKLTSVKDFNAAEGNPLGIRKVGNRKLVTGKKATKKDAAAAAPAAAPAAKGGKK